MGNEAMIVITETDDGVTVAISSENRTDANAALIAAFQMVSNFKEVCETKQKTINKFRLDLN